MGEIDSKKGFSINQTGLIAFIVVVLILVSLGTYIAGKNGTQNPGGNQPGVPATTPKMTTSLAPKTLVYGTWSQSNSQVKAIDLSNGKYQILADLPITIKKVTIASSDTLTYINQTDNKDHGKEIAVYSLTQNKVISTVQAANEFGIDDYVISPNKKYLALWEVSFANGSGVLTGGRSRVYTVDLASPSVKNLIYDEVASGKPVHYPRAILDNGKVLLDTFLPNDPNGGTGWAYGMSVANFDGSGSKDLDQMKNGSYGTQPLLSPDGSKLVFAGYDGSLGAGNTVKNGYRQALLTPNTVETLDVNTLAREKLTNLPNTNTYASVNWDNVTGNLLLSVIGKNVDNSGLYKYIIASGSLERVSVNSENESFIASLSPEKALLGTADESPSSTGNLGEGYQPLYKQFTVQDIGSLQETVLPMPDILMQYIVIVPPNYFDINSSVQAVNGASTDIASGNLYFIDLFSNKNNEKQNLQLYTFLLKPDLGPKRGQQQSDPVTPPSVTGVPSREGKPRCEDLAAQQCKEQGLTSGTKEFDICMINLKVNYRVQNACYDSPLYLYGAEGQKVKVKVNTYVYNSQPEYNDGYEATILNDGKMLVNGITTDSIKYDYIQGIKKINPPSYGSITTRKGLNSVLTNYSQNLGLNEKETTDLISFAENRITSPYVFVSFFDQKKSEEILPLSFTPEPDNYLNIVFYFKEYDTNPAYTPVSPKFGDPLNRSGFTAVEISELVE